MRRLRQYAQRPEVAEFFERLSGFRNLSGLTISTDRRWATLWQVATTRAPADFGAIDSDFAGLVKDQQLALVDGLVDDLRRAFGLGSASLRGSDSGWSCESWDRYVEYDGARARRTVTSEPFVISVHFEEPITPSLTADVAGSVRDTPVRYVLEYRPPAVAVSGTRPLVGGLSIGDDQHFATLGTVLRSTADQAFGVTAGHACAQGDVILQPEDGSPADAIGTCVASTRGDLTPADHCTASTAANVLDVALIELHAPSAARRFRGGLNLDGYLGVDDFEEGDPVTVISRTRSRDLAVADLVHRKRVWVDGIKHCFGDVFMVHRVGQRWGLSGSLRAPISGGDSGSTVAIRAGTGLQWAGLVVASDGPVGYASFAQPIVAWIDDQLAPSAVDLPRIPTP